MIALLAAAAISATSLTTADERAVRAAENRWSAAFVGGDAAYLETLLAPNYVSVGQTGEPHPKSAVIASATKFAVAHPGTKAEPMGPSSTIEVTGDLALVRHSSAQEISIDVLQKRGGLWVAVYSQHTAVASKP